MTDIKDQTTKSGTAGKAGGEGQKNEDRQVYPGFYRVFMSSDDSSPNGYMFCAEEDAQLIEYYALNTAVDSESLKVGDTVLRVVWQGKGSFANVAAFSLKYNAAEYPVRIKAVCTEGF